MPNQNTSLDLHHSGAMLFVCSWSQMTITVQKGLSKANRSRVICPLIVERLAIKRSFSTSVIANCDERIKHLNGHETCPRKPCKG